MTEQKTRQTVGLRKDYGWWALIALALVGFFIGLGVVMVVASHDMWAGGQFRHYAMSVYVYVGGVCAAIMVGVGVLLAVLFDVIADDIEGEEITENKITEKTEAKTEKVEETEAPTEKKDKDEKKEKSD